MDSEIIEQHESYGMLGFSRVSSSHGANFFGSSVQSSHYMILSIKRAERKRDLSQYWYHGRSEIIRLRLSPNQFAELLTTMNIGDGVPCTLERVNGVGMGEPPSVDQREQYHREFKKDVADTIREAKELVATIKQTFDSRASIGKNDRAQIVKQLGLLIGHIENGMPFVQTQFNEAMDKTVAEAKGEVEAFVNHKIHSLGIDALNSEVARALEAPLQSETFRLTDGS